MIDKIIDKSKPKDFEDFLIQLQKNGCTVKRRGKTVSVCPPYAKRFFRLTADTKALPVGYDEESLRKRIADMQAVECEVAALRQRLKRIDKEMAEACTPLERLNAKKNTAKTMQEIKQQENSLFMDRMAVEKKYEDVKSELRGVIKLEASVMRLFLLEVRAVQ